MRFNFRYPQNMPEDMIEYIQEKKETMSFYDIFLELYEYKKEHEKINLVEEISDRVYPDLRVAQLRAGAAEKNTEIILTVLNTMMYTLNIHDEISLTEKVCPAIKLGLDDYKAKMENLQTRRQNRFSSRFDNK